ncbi:OprD family outer membrane porin [Sulfurimonas sp. C5]|uniref:OprD family outer membrane porin n=1 Tax=Sulfurimonas sp. C5 TaxID=3036947 RepID=UPI0024568596|nr:OprD family outer membrane porin [Sulfurimonas sp. C5]MDH4944398.1 OprD family outer membrane porin [Sulfurimonas sp. C5]
MFIIKKKLHLLSTITSIALLSGALQANEPEVRSAIKANGQMVYFEKQKKANSLTDMLKEGNFYGRLRNNNFYFWYDDSTSNTHFISGLGASLVYKSADYNGFDFTIAGYGARAFFSETQDNVNTIKAGKDLFSRFNYVNTGSKSLYTFAQANIAYKISKTKLIAGRQLVETFYTKSNDTKMIPNSFDGVVIESKDIQDSKLKVAYLAKQKLRDHQDSHSVLMYGDASSSSSIHPEWNQNDDSAMHKGLTYTALSTAGKSTSAPLIVLDFQNNSVKDLQINFASYVVPELLSQTMGEVNYNMNLGGFSVTPGVRYIHQFDNGAGAVGGASLTGSTSGYKSPNSLKADMIAARIVTKIDDYKINLGYTNILDKADLVTPWRGFPTAGYTRSMGIYNWRANTKSYRLELVKGDNKTGIYKNGFFQTSVLYVDGDKTKSESDKMFYYFGYIKNLASAPQFQYRFRLGYNDYIKDDKTKTDFIDSRLELNYTF